MQKQDYIAVGVNVSSKKNHADIVLCERTGGYETPMLLALSNAGLSVRAIKANQTIH